MPGIVRETARHAAHLYGEGANARLLSKDVAGRVKPGHNGKRLIFALSGKA
jgi:hypothetical protein